MRRGTMPRGAFGSLDVYRAQVLILMALAGRASRPEWGDYVEDPAGGRRHGYAPFFGQGAAERRLRRDLLRQRPVRLSAPARGAVRAPADRHRDAGDGRDRACPPRGGT